MYCSFSKIQIYENRLPFETSESKLFPIISATSALVVVVNNFHEHTHTHTHTHTHIRDFPVSPNWFVPILLIVKNSITLVS